MKTFLLSLSVILLFSLSFQNRNQFQLSNIKNNSDLKLECPAPPSFAETIRSYDKNSETIDQDWYSKAMENIQKDEYKISYNEKLGAFQSPNRKNNIRFIYNKDGFTAKTRDVRRETQDGFDQTSDVKCETEEEWEIKLRITNYELQMTNSEIQAAGNKAYIENENIRIDYTNNEDGMRQDFIIKNKPEGEGNLRLNISADTKLRIIVGADALMFKDKTGDDKMKYSALKCWDANGRELRAYFEDDQLRVTSYELRKEQLQITNDKLQIEDQKSRIRNSKSQIETNLKSKIQNPKLFSIVVNDEDAVYPITIDPLSTSPSWTEESNQANAQFGYSVSTAGDVNGDGYSEVIVGAPYFDNGVNDAGKIFVYHGSATGLSATANWTSEGNSGMKNVGYSVSTAGDVNGDGYSDAISGAKGIDPWTPQTSGTPENLQDVYFTSPSIGCAVGGNGVIVTTVNGGTNWTLRNSATPNDLRSNWFTTPDSGWAVGLAGTIKVTSNGGANWTTQTSGTATNLSCVYFRTSQEGYVVGGSGLIRKTTNAGVNWTAQTSGITAELRDIIFTSPSEGWIVGVAGRILKTTNGGTNWTLQTSGTTQTLRGVYFSSSSNGLAFGHAGTILKTTDGGTTWTPQISGTTQDLFGCNFTSSSVGWTVGFGSTVLKTTDGGSNWLNQSAGVNGDLRGIFFSSAASGCVAGSGGIVYGFNPASNGSGSLANVYNGSASGLSATPGSILSSVAGISSENSIVSTAGDINGDGYSDVMVGYPNSDSGKGTVLVYHGSASGSQTTPNTILNGSQTGALFGISISTAGDVDGDGYSDIIAGASDFDNGQTDEGKAFVYRGSASGIITTPYWTDEGNKILVRYGYSVSTAGDVNGDGYSDIAIGAPFDKGKVSIYFGSASSISPTSDWEYDGTISGNFGSSVSSAGDINGDGYSDVIIGSPGYDNGQTDEGRILVFNGSAAGLPANANWTIESNQASANFGNCVFTAGDINGDGFSDVIAGAKNYDNGQTDEGRAFVYNGSAAGLSASSGWSAESDQGSSNFGWCVSSAGDVNGDGYSDVLVGARYFDNGEADEGAAFLYNGSSSGLSAVASWTAEGGQTNSQFGTSVSPLGDVNGDGYSDIIVGAPLHDNGQTDEGLVFVYYGSASGLPVGYSWYAEGNQANSGFGWTVSTAGDVNGDGYSDVIIGANIFDKGQTDEGAAFVYHGSASGLIFPAVPNWIGENNQAGSNFGTSVSTAGDVNGDGYSDVIIGARYYDLVAPIDNGSASIYYGSSSGLPAVPNLTLSNNQGFSAFGFSVSTAGDVNGDGYSDVLVGAPLFNNPILDEGKVFAYYGSATGTSTTPNWSAESDQVQAIYGNSVACAGDVNGDGYSDVIIGSYSFDNGQTDEGSAFCYYGSSTGLSITANWTAESDQAGAFFGNSVASAGDVNGDGYSDVIIGDPYYSNGQTEEGKAFCYYGNGGNGLSSLVQQFKPGSFNVISSGGLSGADGQVRYKIFGKSSYGRAIGTFVYEHKENGIPFSGNVITNSTAFSNSSSDVDLGNPSVTGTELYADIFGLNPLKVYKWRTRIKYNFGNNPYQRFGPWKYYNNYNPVPVGNFRSQAVPSATKTLNVNALIQGFYNPVTNSMISDTVIVKIINFTPPYNIIDSKTLIVSTTGQLNYGTVNTAIINNTLYYLQITHRNSLETWNKGSVFTSSNQTFDFTPAAAQAYGNNMVQIDASPVRYALYSGDVNQDGNIEVLDQALADDAAFNFITGYVNADVNGNNVVDATDLAIIDNNAFDFVSKISP